MDTWDQFRQTSPRRPRIVSLIGMPGVGKTSVLSQLAARSHSTPPVFVGRPLFNASADKAMSALDAARLKDEPSTWNFGAYQHLFLHGTVARIHLVLSQVGNADIVLLDRAFEDVVFVTETLRDLGLLSPPVRTEYFYPLIARACSSACLMLRASTETLRRRLKMRGDAPTSKDLYFRLFAEHYEPWFRRHATRFVAIDTDDRDVDDVTEQVQSFLDHFRVQQ